MGKMREGVLGYVVAATGGVWGMIVHGMMWGKRKITNFT